MDLLHTLTLGDILRENRRSYPERLAVVDGDVRLTYPELDDRVNELANALTDAGVTAGDRVLWLGQNSFRVLECLLGAAKLGAVCCPANWRQSPDEFAFTIDDCAARWSSGRRRRSARPCLPEGRSDDRRRRRLAAPRRRQRVRMPRRRGRRNRQ